MYFDRAFKLFGHFFMAGLFLCAIALPYRVHAGSCSFSCQPYRGTTAGAVTPVDAISRSSREDCLALCRGACPGYLTPAARARDATITEIRCVEDSVVYDPSVAAAGTPDCGHAATQERTRGFSSSVDPRIQENWVCAVTTSDSERSLCSAYPGCSVLNSQAYCCPLGVGNTAIGRSSAAPTANTTAAPAVPASGLPGALGLPNCATTHDPATAGKCTLDDIKTVAVNFANFLMGLAAAVFLAIFVWAGFKYIFFAYDSGVASDARNMLTGAAIGMLLILGAALIVRFVQTAATGQASTTQVSPAPLTTAANPSTPAR